MVEAMAQVAGVLGAVVDGCPPGMELSEADIQPDLERRRPGKTRHTTQRREMDEVQILSGVFEGRTTGTPIGLLIENTDQRSRDYSKVKDIFRPGHADWTFQASADQYTVKNLQILVLPAEPRKDTATVTIRVDGAGGAATPDFATTDEDTLLEVGATNSYAEEVLADAPIAYWRLGEASNALVAVDATGFYPGDYGTDPNSGDTAVLLGVPGALIVPPAPPEAAELLPPETGEVAPADG